MARAYAKLSTCKHRGFSNGPIPWTVMVDWCRYYRMPRDTSDHLMLVVSMVDGIFMRREADKSKLPPSRSGAPSRASRAQGPIRRR